MTESNVPSNLVTQLRAWNGNSFGPYRSPVRDLLAAADEIERLAAESEARHQSCLVLMRSIQDHRSEIERLRAALRRVEAWDKFPVSGHLFENGHPMSYGAAFGSNGERDHMRRVARDALQAETKPESPLDWLPCADSGCPLNKPHQHRRFQHMHAQSIPETPGDSHGA